MKYEKWTNEKIAKIAILCKTKQEMKMKFPKEYAAAKRMDILNHSMFSHMPKRFKKKISSKWSEKKNILMESLKYSSKKAFFEGNQSCYNAAKKNGWFEEACSHMPKNLCIGNKPSTYKWTKEAVTKEALKYNEKREFAKKSAGAYDAAVKNRWLNEVCAHMKILKRHHTISQLKEIFKDCKNKKEAREKDTSAYCTVKNKKLKNIIFSHMPKRIDMSGENSPFYKWTNEDLRKIALNYNNRVDFMEGNRNAYDAAYKRGVLDDICIHMGEPVTKAWERGDLAKEALKHNTRVDFQKNNSGAYQAAKKRGILDEICTHMKRSCCVSSYEKDLFDHIKSLYPQTKKLRDSKVKIANKPYIRGFDIDIFVPELGRGIEFDGEYWHSFETMRKSEHRSKWSDSDIHNYHQIKDNWFVSKGIKILHIKEEDWLENKEACIQKCLEFLGA